MSILLFASDTSDTVDTCHDLDEGQTLTTTNAPCSFDCRSRGREIGRAKLIGALKYFWALLKVYASEDLVHYYEFLKLRLKVARLDCSWRVN